MGSVPRWQLGLGALLRMDLGWLRALGMGALSLRALDVVRQFLVVVAGTGVGRGILPSVLAARICVVLRIRRIRCWFRLGGLWLVAHRALRPLLTVLGWLWRPVRRSG